MNVMTPRRAIAGGVEMHLTGDSGEIDIAGTQVPVSIVNVANPASISIGLDVNGNGKVDPNEMQKVKNGMAAFKVKLGDKDKKEYAIVINGITVLGKGKVESAFAGYYSVNCYKCSINGVNVRLIDENLDGQITQDGKDAIVIGQSQYAQPLLKQHMIGNAMFDLTVAADGTSIEFTKQATKLAQIEVPLLKAPSVGCLIMVDQESGRAVDLVTNKAGIPSGSYKLCYGTIGQGKDQLMIRPGGGSPAMALGSSQTSIASPSTYEIKDDVVNVLKLGPTFKVAFQAFFNSAKNEVTVSPRMMAVEGAGKESYNVNINGLKAPQIAFMEGNKQISRESMGST